MTIFLDEKKHYLSALRIRFTVVKETLTELKENPDVRELLDVLQQPTNNNGNTLYENIFNSKFSFFPIIRISYLYFI
jgi:hypothetical protein